MSCILRIAGEDFDVDAFISKSTIVAYNRFYKGDAKYKSKPDGTKVERSGCAIEVSKVEFENFHQQVDDAILYLNQNKEKLQLIKAIPEIQYAVLDFGVDYASDKLKQNH